jgi:ABC-type branched-subunit amino acid transport system substrate-binding protein
MRSLRTAFIVVFAVVLAACGSSSKSGTKGTSGGGTSAPAVQDKSLGPGVTDTTVKVGVSLIDFDCIKQFTDTIRLDQESYYKAFADDINKKGGVGGKQVVLDIKKSCPITAGQASKACTDFTEDDKVFAVVGLIYDTSGAAQTCVAKQHKTPMMTYLINQATIDKSPPGLMLLAGATLDRSDTVMGKLMKENNTLAGKKIAILSGSANKKQVTESLEPALKSLGIPMAPTTLMNIGTTGDTTAAQSQLDSAIDNWKSSGVTAVFVTGDESVAKQFIEKIKKQMPTVQLVSDTYTALLAAQEDNTMKPNPYQGMINIFGQTREEYAQSQNWKYCADIYKAQTGIEATPPTATIKQGQNTIDKYSSINDPCTLLTLFKTIGDKVGPYLNIANWTNAVNNLGSFNAPGNGPYASLKTNKYDMDDTFRLVQFDSSIGTTGDYKSLTPVENGGS